MDVEKYMVCRLCLRIVPEPDEFVLIEETARHLLNDVLQVEMNLDVSNNPVMCMDCGGVVRRAHSFKSMCKNSKESIFCDKTNMDLCRFCIKKVEESNFISLDVLMKENTFSDMIKEFVPQMDLNIIKNSIICLYCHDNMERYFRFLRNCSDTEEKINTYQQNNAIGSDGKIMLCNVFETFFKNIKEEEETGNSIKKEFKQEVTKDETEIYPLMYQNREVQNNNILDTKDCSIRSSVKFEEASDTKDIKTETAPSEMNNLAFKIETEELIIKDDVTLNETTGQEKEVKKLEIKTETVSSEMNNLALKIETEELIIKNKVTLNKTTGQEKEVKKMRICVCKIKTKMCVKCNSQVEIVSTRPRVYKCKLCPFQGPKIRFHLLTHRDMSEVQIYQCRSCKFQTKHKNTLKLHVLTHKESYSASAQVYHCDSCKYETIDKDKLRRHTLTHKSPSELQKLYQCDSCEYYTKFTGSLNRHMLMHKNLSEIQMHQCDLCNFKTKYKDYLKKHLLTHKDVSELQMYKCHNCEYQTKRKGGLKLHMLTHKNLSEVKVYQCDICNYQTKYKHSLRNHMLIHSDISGV